MATISPPLMALIAQRHGVVTRAELIGDGFTRESLRHHVDAGTILAVHQGVYRVATSPDTFESRCAAASLADPLATITGVSAARL